MLFNEYKYILIPIYSLIICQVIKFLIESVKYRKIKISRLFNGSGGMPSSHTTLVTSLVTAIGIGEGTNSVYFAISLVFAGIVIYDSMGVRRESGIQAETINDIIDEMLENEWDLELKELKEQIGHNPIEVFFGTILGLVLGIVFMLC